MLKLKTLITEQEFKAKSKETGRVVVYKSKDSMDKAIKGGKAEPLDKKTGQIKSLLDKGPNFSLYAGTGFSGDIYSKFIFEF